jgi:serine/threonine protein kinase
MMTGVGVILGTAAYMSPEQARGRTVDKRADIWAFGCVVYEMLAGRAAFARDTVTDTLAAIVEREPDWAALSSATPPGACRRSRCHPGRYSVLHRQPQRKSPCDPCVADGHCPSVRRQPPIRRR